MRVLLGDRQIKNSRTTCGETDTGLKASIHPLVVFQQGYSVTLDSNLLQMHSEQNNILAGTSTEQKKKNTKFWWDN